MPTDILLPKVSLSLVSADTDVANAPQKVLIVGQKVAGGSATSGNLYSIDNSGVENTLFGKASQLAESIRAFKRIAPQVQLDVIPLSDNGSGVAAAYTLTVTGTATEAGTILVNVGSKKRHTVSAAVTSGDAAAAICAAITAAINADTSAQFTAVDASPVVTLTCVNDGTVGNGVPIGVTLNGRSSGLLGGVTIAVAQSVVGSTDPTDIATSAIFDVIGNNRYQGIVWPYPSMTVPGNFFDARFNTNNRILDGVVFGAKVDTYANCVSAAESYNHKSVVLFADEAISTSNYVGASWQEAPYNVISCFAALRALRLTSGASLTQYLVTKSSSDQYGGVALASLPYFNSTIPQLNISYPIASAGFTQTEITALNVAGASVIGQNATGTGSLIGEVVTTYKTDGASNPDVSWKYLNYVDTMSNIREYFFNNYKATFSQSRLTEGSVIRGRDMVNRSKFEAYTDKLYGDLTGADFVLCQGGEAARKFFKDNRTVVLDLSTGTVTVNMLVPIVTQTRNIIGTIKLTFSTEG